MTEEMKNIRGLFPIELGGETYECACNFGLIERLETKILKRPIVVALQELGKEVVGFVELVDVVHSALIAAGAKLTRSEIGDHIMVGGLRKYADWYGELLAYAVTGKTQDELVAEVQTEDEVGEAKKK